MQLGGLWERCKLPLVRSGVQPQRKSDLVHYSLEIWHPVVSILPVFLRINWPHSVCFFSTLFCSSQVHKIWYDVSIKILIFQITGCRTCSCTRVTRLLTLRTHCYCYQDPRGYWSSKATALLLTTSTHLPCSLQYDDATDQWSVRTKQIHI